jgi:hypothetical protein
MTLIPYKSTVLSQVYTHSNSLHFRQLQVILMRRRNQVYIGKAGSAMCHLVRLFLSFLLYVTTISQLLTVS